MPNICLSVSADALKYNFKLLRAQCAMQEIGAVVKADAYGLGMKNVLPALESAGCDCFFVNRLEEGINARTYTTAPVYVFDGLMEGEKIADYHHHKLTPVFSTYESLLRFPDEKQIAVRLDTGLNMAGLSVFDQNKFHACLEGRDVALLLSHLSCSEHPFDDKNKQQLALFQQAAALFPKAKKSLAASYGIALGKEYWFDMVRSGASLYGADILKGSLPVARLTAKVGWVQAYAAGRSIGYNHTAVLTQPAVIATLLIGSGDGIVHKKGCFVAYHGHLLPVIGNPTTNYLAVEATVVADRIKPGDEVDLFNEAYTPDRLALDAGTGVGADVLIRLSASIFRQSV